MNTRGMSRDMRELVQAAEDEGWSWSITRGGHLKLEHPEASAPVFAAQTPSDYRAAANTRADMARALRGEPTVVREVDPEAIAAAALEAAGQPPPPPPVLNEPRQRLLELGWCDGASDREAQAAALTDAEVRRFTRELRDAEVPESLDAPAPVCVCHRGPDYAARCVIHASQDAPDAPGAPEAGNAAQPPPEPSQGVWCVYNWDAAPYVVAIFGGDDEIGALRRAVRDHHSARFVAFGDDVADCLRD
jgi:hypothetical protein